MCGTSEEEIKNYIRAGEVSYRVKDYVRKLVRPGVKLVEIAEKVESYIRELNAQPAFPLNISVNEIAAHRTPLIDDDEMIPEDSIVKVDIGVHVNGYIADTAITLVFNDKLRRLADAASDALEKAILAVGPGVKFSEVGAVIESTIRKHGFRVIKNLSGHSLDRYNIHAGDIIPNYKDLLSYGKFRIGRAYAIEPFATNGKGAVTEVGQVQIYALKKTKLGFGLTDKERMVLEVISERFKTLPFCERWLRDVIGDVANLRSIVRSLVHKGYLRQYPVLVEIKAGAVSQFEETIYISKEGVIITSNPEFSGRR
ncbi:MAG: type II methionyl aminopeptidase [Desulfurococcales archaeon]|nr:type II methionyl aminopeptidase [Desulfurococcales archaeon]